MSTASVSELNPRPMNVEALQFVTEPTEALSARDVVNALVGVTTALDFGVTPRDEHSDEEVRCNLATAARLLAEQLQSRLSRVPARRRERTAP